jgi:hypothetical protein
MAYGGGGVAGAGTDAEASVLGPGAGSFDGDGAKGAEEDWGGVGQVGMGKVPQNPFSNGAGTGAAISYLTVVGGGGGGHGVFQRVRPRDRSGKGGCGALATSS